MGGIALRRRTDSLPTIRFGQPFGRGVTAFTGIILIARIKTDKNRSITQKRDAVAGRTGSARQGVESEAPDDC